MNKKIKYILSLYLIFLNLFFKICLANNNQVLNINELVQIFNNYEIKNNDEILKVRTLISNFYFKVYNISISDIINDKYSFLNLNNSIDNEKIITLFKIFKNINLNSLIIRVNQNKAAVYFTLNKGISDVWQVLYLTKENNEWLIDFEYLLKLLKNKTNNLYLDTETFLLSEQIYFLSQKPLFKQLTKIFNNDFIYGLNISLNTFLDIRNQLTNILSGPSLYFYLSLYNFKIGKYKQAYSYINLCRAIVKDEPIVEIIYNMIVSHRKFTKLIADDFIDCIKDDPYNCLALMILAEYYSSRGRYEEANFVFNQVLKFNINLTPHYHIVYSNVLSKLHQFEKAGDELSKCKKYGEEFYYLSYLSALEYIKANQLNKAALEFEHVINYLSYASTKREVAYWLSNYYKNISWDEKKYKYYSYIYYTSLINSPDFILLLIGCWLIFVFRKKVIKYIISVFQLIAYYIKNEWLIDKIFKFYCFKGEFELALNLYKSLVLSFNKNDIRFEKISLKFAHTLLLFSKTNYAKKIFNDVLNNNPFCNEALIGLGICEYELKNFNTALEYFKSLIETLPENPEVYYYAGLCLIMLGNSNDGLELLEIAIKINVHYDKALNFYTNYCISNNQINLLTKLYDDIIFLGNYSENFIQKYLKLHRQRMDYNRIEKLLEKIFNLNIKYSYNTIFEIALSLREINRPLEALHYFILSIFRLSFISNKLICNYFNYIERIFFVLIKFNLIRKNKIYLLELGITYKILNEQLKANIIFNKIIKYFPNCPIAYFMLHNFKYTFELIQNEMNNEYNLPTQNLSLFETMIYCLHELNQLDHNKLNIYFQKVFYYASNISDELGFFSYKHLKYVHKSNIFSLITTISKNKHVIK